MEKPTQNQGFTLLELMVTLAIATVILTIGIPSFRELIANSTITSEVNRLISLVHLARTEAIKRNQNAVLCATSDGSDCSHSIEWQRGFLVFIDNNHNRNRDESEPVVAWHSPKSNRVIIKSSTSLYGRKTLSYNPVGMAPGSTATITFCDFSKIGKPKALIISNTGRPRISTKRPDGSEINCG